MPTVAIDYTPAIRQRAGIGRIIRGQVQALIDLQPDFDIRLFVVGPVTPAEQDVAPLDLHTTPISERNMVRLWHRLNSPVPQVEWFAGGALDLFHATDFVMAPNRATHKFVTVHDLAFLYYPDAAMPSLHRYLNVVVPRSIHRADHLLADSHHTAHDLTQEWGISPDSITVVQGAVDHEHFFPAEAKGEDMVDAEAKESAGTGEGWRERYGIGDGPFILGLSTLEPRKNFARLIQAFHRARHQEKLPHRLIIGGKKGWLYDEIFATVQELGLEDSVHFPGFIGDDDLPKLYQSAEFFAFPSLYEGFGLPIVEALACGTPVLTANNSCLPEAGGDGALYVDAEDIDSIAQGILKLATDATLRDRLRQAGLSHAARFTWSNSAHQLLRAYQTCL